MRLERSAGVILFRLLPDGSREFLLLDYGKHWDFAKGHVEPGEDDRAAALRELQEETGIRQADVIEEFAHEIDYVFRGRDRQLIKKTVIFFLGRTRDTEVRLSHEHVGFAWLSEEPALKTLTYPNARAVLRAALATLNRVGTL